MTTTVLKTLDVFTKAALMICGETYSLRRVGVFPQILALPNGSTVELELADDGIDYQISPDVPGLYSITGGVPYQDFREYTAVAMPATLVTAFGGNGPRLVQNLLSDENALQRIDYSTITNDHPWPMLQSGPNRILVEPSWNQWGATNAHHFGEV